MQVGGEGRRFGITNTWLRWIELICSGGASFSFGSDSGWCTGRWNRPIGYCDG